MYPSKQGKRIFLFCFLFTNIHIMLGSSHILQTIDPSSGSKIFQTVSPTPEFGPKTYYLARFLPKTT